MIYVKEAKSKAGRVEGCKLIGDYRFKLPTKCGYTDTITTFRFNLANNFWPEINKHKHEQNAGKR